MIMGKWDQNLMLPVITSVALVLGHCLSSGQDAGNEKGVIGNEAEG